LPSGAANCSCRLTVCCFHQRKLEQQKVRASPNALVQGVQRGVEFAVIRRMPPPPAAPPASAAANDHTIAWIEYACCPRFDRYCNDRNLAIKQVDVRNTTRRKTND
jgi:hypothetical protein